MATATLSHNPTQHLGSHTSSSMDKKDSVKLENTSKSSPVQTKSGSADTNSEESKAIPPVSEPLAPPPRPAPANPAETPDYFSVSHNGTNEFNPFEQSFGAPSTETPGKSLLPSVAALASPAIPGAASTPGFGWGNSLRSGPLSPAMLTGPAGSTAGDYFDRINGSFPTPNESGLRTGLTPGGGGSMFPAPSPGTSALFQQLQSGTATPGTLDFHRTAMNAAARNKNNQFAQTSNPQDQHSQSNSMDQKQDPFAQHDATDAANGLFMLAKGGQSNNQFPMPQASQQQLQAKQMQDNKRVTRNNGSMSTNGANGNGESPESYEENSRANIRGGAGRGKKTVKAEAAATNRRKSEATPKGGNKRAKGNSGVANVDPNLEPNDEDDDDDDDMSDDGDNGPQDKKGQTDEEKRRNFLERNRVAALKCRQRKKQWLANLQAKVEMYSQENDQLSTTVSTLHEEIRHLRGLLMSHKECPVGHAQGLNHYLNASGDMGMSNQHVNPYGMAMSNGGMRAGMQQS